MQKLLPLTLLAIPYVTLANQIGTPVGNQNDIQRAISNTGIFLSDVIIPFLIALAFIFFVFNAIRYFVIDAATEDGRENAKNLAVYSLLAFVIIFIFWGLINILATSTNLQNGRPICPDYFKNLGACV